MMAVKIIRAPQDRIEGEINAFLQALGSAPGMITKIENTQLVHVGGSGMEEAFVILYNHYKAPEPPAAEGAITPKKPGPKGPGAPIPPTKP